MIFISLETLLVLDKIVENRYIATLKWIISRVKVEN